MTAPVTTLFLTREEIERLATYNAEVARGIVHTEEYKRGMELLQVIFDRSRHSEPLASRRADQ